MKREAAACKDSLVVHTIGHSTHDIETFLGMLEPHRIELLVDIRRWPSSRRFPHFNKDPLSSALEERGIGYEWIEALGGYRKPLPDSPNTAWRVGAFRAYADYMLTDEFKEVFRPLQQAAGERRTAIMCAEAVPWRCHRQILSDAFVVRGFTVRHIIGDRCEVHLLPDFAQVDGDSIVYKKTDTLF